MIAVRTLAGALAAALLAACAPNPVTAPADGILLAPAPAPVPAVADGFNMETALLNSPFNDHLPWDRAGANVKTAPGGLQYIVLKEGPVDGKTPVATDRVSVHYDGRRVTGEQFDSSFVRGEPAQFRLDEVIPGWTQGLQLMSEGDEYLFFIPNALAYGPQDRGPVIKAGDDLLFHVALLNIVPPLTADTAAWAKYAPWKSSLPEVVKTGSGLEYVVLESGDPAGLTVAPGKFVLVHYEGRFAATGETFDSSYARGQPAEFPSNQVIPGWTEALSLMRKGDRWMVFVPAALAYGAQGGGPIPPNSDLQFEIELLDLEP